MAKAIHHLLKEKDLNRLPPGMHNDGGRLYLNVDASGARRWVLRYDFQTARHKMGLGNLETRTLEEAREAAHHCRELLARGINPLELKAAARREAELERIKLKTVRQCGEEYIEAKGSKWSPQYREEWSSSLERYVYPALGELPVAEIEAPHIIKALTPIWQKVPVTAGRVRYRIYKILARAKAAGYRTGENPAQWEGHLAEVFQRPRTLRPVEHFAAMHWSKAPEFREHMRDESKLSARVLEFVLLTAARNSEARLATWSEIDLDRRLWTIPAARMKKHRAHVVPLSEGAIAVLTGIMNGPRTLEQQASPYVFAKTDGKPMVIFALNKSLEESGFDCTTHGFRAVFGSWALATTSHSFAVIETALAHKIRGEGDGQTVAAYQGRDILLAKRRELMAQWDQFTARPFDAGEVSEAEVIPFKRQA